MSVQTIPGRQVLLAVLAAILAGCAVGPDFHTPAPPATKSYTATPLPAQTAAADTAGGTAQHFVPGGEIPALWWQLFRSEPLDRLIRAGLADSPTLDAAQAALRQAQENLNAQVASVLYPGVDANLSAKRQHTSGAAFGLPEVKGNIFNLYNASVSVSYALDISGGARRELEALRAQIDYQRYQLEAAYLTLTSNIVTTAVREASLREQIRATQEIVAAQEQQLKVVEKQLDLGAVGRPEVLAQQAQLAQTRATLPPLDKALAQTRHALAVLIGRFPADAALPEFSLAGLTLPQELPVSLPSALARQRPDIQASEALLHQASAEIGVATAAMYPQITLSGSYGSVATRTANLFTGGGAIWNIGANLLQPLFHGGELTAKRRGAVAAYDQAFAQYRQTVLMAFQDVADVLQALETDARTLQAQAEAETAARASLDLTHRQFELGAASYLALLNAERQYQQAKIGLVQAQAARYADTAALFQALGGGWWRREAQADAAAPVKTDVYRPREQSAN